MSRRHVTGATRSSAAATVAMLVAAACASGSAQVRDDVPLEVSRTTRPDAQSSPPSDDDHSDVVAAPIERPLPASFELQPVSTTTADGDGPTSILARLPDLTGQTITVLGPETGRDADDFVAALAPFESATGATIAYTGTTDDVVVLDAALDADDPPDVAVIAQPGRLLDLADSGDALPLPDSIATIVASDFDATWSDLTSRRGFTYAIPNRVSVKSLVWFRPEDFEANGYEVPVTWDELLELTATIRDDGRTPWCIGISSGEATGWVFTDWLEDAMLRLHGPIVYDQWVAHEIDFSDERVLEAIDLVSEIWFVDANVAGSRDDMVATTFSDAGLPLLEGDCLMHRQASFYAANYLDAGAEPGEDVDAFYLPTVTDDFGDVVLGAGNFFAGFTPDDSTNALLAYLASADYALTRIEVSGGSFLSPNRTTTQSDYPPGIGRRLAGILLEADPFRFDASDLMPGAVGADELWRASTAYVTGSITAQDLVDRIDAAWPS